MATEYFKQADLSEIQPPKQGDRVYKDDCMFSFNTPLEPEGLDVCMSCFQAFSRGDFDYTEKHAELYGHEIYLNIQRTAKKSVERPAKLLKLEVKEKAEDELFETKLSVYVEPEKTSVPYPNAQLPEVIRRTAEGIMSATSSEKKQEVKSWQQEIMVCKHTSQIPQTPSIKSIEHCSECDLSTNLWICLTCGNIGCGREQFGGVPGHSHAAAHYKNNPDHHIACKLGSLSSDSADCYCYTCDDDVKVPDLARYLSTYGIDLAQHEKTEKNLTELQIEQNVQWDFKMDSNGEAPTPVFGKGLTGFKNLGNSCYMASVLQAAFATEPFQKAYLSDEGMPMEKIVGNMDPAGDLETQMYKLGDGLLSGRYSVPDDSTTEEVKYQRGIKPSTFKALIGEGHPEFSTMQQQDAFEFWTYFMGQLEKKHIEGNSDTLPTESFHFATQDKIKCSECGGIRVTASLDESLCVPVEANLESTDEDGSKHYTPVSMEQCIDQWNSVEKIEYSCPVCKKQTATTKQTGFASFGDYLLVSPQRIQLQNWVPVKLTVPIKFDETLDLERFRAEGQLPGETEFPEETSPAFEANADAMEGLTSMGFPENRCLRALYETGNSDAEAAANWLFGHMDDPDIDAPFEVPAGGSSKNEANPQDIESLVGMGFAPNLANKALLLNGGNVEQSVEWLFSNPDDDGTMPTEEAGESDEDKLKRLTAVSSKGTYALKAVVCHKGVSIHSGHYVAFVKKNIDGKMQWVLFNDEKVIVAGPESLKEIESSGYLYVYKRTD